MAQNRSLIVLGLAILLGLAAVYIANAYLTRAQLEQAQPSAGTARIFVAAAPLPFGTVITPDKVKLVDWPLAAMPAGSFNAPEQLGFDGKPRVVLRQMELNEPILASKLAGEGGRASLSAVLRPEMRATAVKVSDVAAAGGFILPGDTVDVLVTRQVADAMGGAGQQVTDVLLQAVRVIAIDQNSNDGSKDPQIGKTATLEVSQIDSQKLTLGQAVGQLTLVLRAPSNKPNASVQTVGMEDLRDGAYVGGFHSRGPGYYPGPALAGLPANLSQAPAAVSRPAVRRPAVPRPLPAATTPVLPTTAVVEIVRGLNGTSYEVKRYGVR